MLKKCVEQINTEFHLSLEQVLCLCSFKIIMITTIVFELDGILGWSPALHFPVVALDKVLSPQMKIITHLTNWSLEGDIR